MEGLSCACGRIYEARLGDSVVHFHLIRVERLFHHGELFCARKRRVYLICNKYIYIDTILLQYEGHGPTLIVVEILSQGF
jgi:hypothetical protein